MILKNMVSNAWNDNILKFRHDATQGILKIYYKVR